MLCSNPVIVNSHPFACGGCECCRINRKRVWANRLMLEAAEHGSNAFVTLTYSQENLPLCLTGLPTLAPEHVRNWLKRLRKQIAPARIRYFLVGEYGDHTERPHYHAALFGFQRCKNGRTLRFRNRALADKCCVNCRIIQSSWGHGDVEVGGLEEGSARYLCGYVLKKMTRYDDRRLHGRSPEFARMSLRPGLGHRAMHDIADVILRYGLDKSEADVPGAIRRGSAIQPLGRYLRGQLRLMIGKEVTCPDEVLMEAAEKLRPVREAAFNASSSFKAAIVETFAQEVLNRNSKARIFSKRGHL